MRHAFRAAFFCFPQGVASSGGTCFVFWELFEGASVLSIKRYDYPNHNFIRLIAASSVIFSHAFLSLIAMKCASHSFGSWVHTTLSGYMVYSPSSLSADS